MSSPMLSLDFLVAVVAHRALLADRLPSYLSLLVENGFSLLHQTHVILSSDHTSLLLGQGVDDELEVFAAELPACVLLLQRVDAYATFDGLREQLDFVYGSINRWTALRDQQTFFPTQPVLERALLVLQPGYSQDDYATVMDALEAERFITIDLVGKILTPDQAALLCGENKPAISTWTSDVSVFIALERLNAQSALTLLLGPEPPALARIVAPNSLRARLTSSMYCSASTQQAAEDSRICWPDGFPLQRTVLVLGGPALNAESDILASIDAHGFTVIRRESTYLPRARIEKLWTGRIDIDRADDLLSAWAAEPSIALLLTKAAAVTHARVLADGLRCSAFVYASSSDSALADARELFPLIPPAPAALTSQEVLARFTAPLPVPTPGATPASLQSVLTDALIALCKAKPAADDAVPWLADYLLHHNPVAPTVTVPTATTPDAPAPLTAPRSVWVLGDGGSAAVAELVKAHGFVHVDARAVLEAAVANDAGVGLAVSEYVGSERAVPSGLVLPLLRRAIAAGESGRVVVSGFPRDLDQAFAYEEQVGPVSALVVQGGVPAVEDDGGQAVVEHYRAFGKIIAMEAELDEKTATNLVQRVLRSIEA